MYEPLPDRLADALAHPAFVSESADVTLRSSYGLDEAENAAVDVEADSFLDLLAELERHSIDRDRNGVIASYHAWIGRHSSASPALYAVWFNLGVELSGKGDKAGAIDAYQNALLLRPGFYPAAINLGTLLETTGQPDSALAIWQQALQPEEARTALLQHRARLTEIWRDQQQNPATVLYVACGANCNEQPPPAFRRMGWQEIRLDIDPDVRPDITTKIADMHGTADFLVDAVYLCDLTRLHPPDVSLVLREMHRVLKPPGFAVLRLPDLQEVARRIAEGRLEDPVYMSPAGPIAPLDILYGHRMSVATGNRSEAPRTGFTSATLAAALIKAGFAAAMVQRDPPAYRLTAVAFRTSPDEAQTAMVQAQILPAADLPAVLYTSAS